MLQYSTWAALFYLQSKNNITLVHKEIDKVDVQVCLINIQCSKFMCNPITGEIGPMCKVKRMYDQQSLFNLTEELHAVNF